MRGKVETAKRSESVPVLLVEDDESQRQFITHLLKRDASLNVLTAQDGEAALVVARQTPPAVVLSDFYMTGMSGIDLCREFKSDDVLRESMFILITASNVVEDRVLGLDSGADDFVTKPVHPDELLSRVRASLRIKGMRDELKEDKKSLAELNKSLQEGYSGVLQLLVRLIGMRIPNATARAERAEKMARWIGERVEMEPNELEALGTAAMLHEIGKIGFPDELLKKGPEILTEGERNEIGSFPTFGERIVAGIPKLKTVARLLRHQLENYDGTGYPDKLMNRQIPEGARILRAINLVEQYSARNDNAAELLLNTVLRLRGTVLDPIVVQFTEEYLRVVENPSWLDDKLQVNILDLKPGMVLAHDLTTGGGTKLLPKDTTITLSQIDRILSLQHFDPVINGIYVRKAQSAH